MMHLVTGHAGIEHIKPSDDGAFNAGVVGTGKYVFDLGNKFEYEIVSNNLVKIKDGELVNQGRHSRIPVNNYEEVTIENGLQGVKRYDLICARYTKNADTSIESADLVVVKGTSSTTPSDPACVEGNILEDALVDDFPLYRVRLDGLNIVGVDCLFEVIPSLATVNAKADKNAEDIKTLTALTTKKTGTIIHNVDGTWQMENLEKQGNMVLFSFRVFGISVIGNDIVATLPEGFRPKTVKYIGGKVIPTTGTATPHLFTVNPDGTIIAMYSWSNAVTDIHVEGVFLTD